MADLSTRYATALFSLSAEKGNLSYFLEHACVVRDSLQDEDALRLITHPMVKASDKRAFLKNTFEGRIDDDLLGFMQLTVAKNREAFIVPALTGLIKMIRTHLNQTTARVVTACELSEEQTGRLANLLSRKLGKQVDIQLVINPEVIAGISIQVDGFYVDKTMKYELKKMNESVKRGAVHES